MMAGAPFPQVPASARGARTSSPGRPSGQAPAGQAPAGDATSSVAELVSAVSHELRQPLASIRGFTEMLLAHWGEFSDAEKMEMLVEVLHDAVRVGRLMDELVDMSRLGGGRQRLSCVPTQVRPLVERAVRNVKVSYPGMEAALDLPGELPAVTVDPFKIEQVLTNILENACKHGAAGPVLVTAAVVSPGAAGAVEVSVSDQGDGIPAAELPHVADKFFRGAAADQSGLGLGLWISRGIVEAHGGRLDAGPADGHGTTVRFTIPLRPEPPPGTLAGT
jgi:signal transduction histidine kinase